MTLPFPRSAPGPSLAFAVTDADHDPTATGPTLRLHTTITESTGTRVHALALRVQIRVEPASRRYRPEQRQRLVELFGEPARWGRTLNPMQLATVSTVTPAFRGEHSLALEVPMTLDTEIATTRYFRGLAGVAATDEVHPAALPDHQAADDDAGVVPLRLLFTGTVFYEGSDGVQIGLVPWHTETTFGLPVAAWARMVRAHHGGTAWLQLSERTLADLAAWRAGRALPSWEQAFAALLAAAEGGEASPPPAARTSTSPDRSS